MSQEDNRARVLIVDDSPVNVSILMAALRKEFALGSATDGIRALQYVASTPPDLILLDVMMPEMDGYEVCQRLREADETRQIPVIFVTALTDMKAKARGFELGAADYITKPFEIAEVRLRVRNHIELARYRREQVASERTRVLAQTAAAAAHEIKNPLSTVTGHAELLLARPGLESIREGLEAIHRSAVRIGDIVEQMRDCAGYRTTSYANREEIVVFGQTR